MFTTTKRVLHAFVKLPADIGVRVSSGRHWRATKPRYRPSCEPFRHASKHFSLNAV